MKKQIVKILFTCLSAVLISFTSSNELKAQVFFDIHPSGNIQLCAGATVTITADPLPPGYTYQWMMEDYGLNTCGFNIVPIWGETNQSYTASATSVYWCEAIDINGQSAGTSMSPAWVASLSDSVKICYNSPLNFCKPDSLYLSVLNLWDVGVFNPDVQWQLNGTDIPGADRFYYYAKTSGTYRCRLINNCGFKYTNSVVVTANVLPSALITAGGPTTFCSGGNVVLNAVVAANRTYQWKKGANLILGATLSSYTATTGGSYRVIVTNTVTGCSKTTAQGSIVTINSLPSATITPQGPTTFCAGGSVVLAANTGTGLTYKWKKGSNFISGATLSNYTATTGGNYKVQVTNSNGCSKLSAGVVVSVPCREGEITSLKNNLDFNVYPNPNSGEFTIEFSAKPTSPVLIELTDELGKVVKRFETNDETVVIKESNLAKGIYCLKVWNKNEVLIKKINIVK